MSQSIWEVRDSRVFRRGVKMANIFTQPDGKLTWEGFGHKRINCDNEADVLADVKYFHAHPQPALTMTFASGRRVIYDRQERQ